MKKLLINFLTLCITLIICIIIAEVILRVMRISYPYFTRVDKYTGFALRPFAEGWQRDEGEAYVKINSQGLRDREHSIGKPENTIRIAILGDSYAEAKQVDINKTFWSVLEKELKSCENIKEDIEVINFGVSGFSTAQELQMLKGHVWKYDPDIVILAFMSGTDIEDNSFIFEQNDQKPYYVLENGKLTLDNSFRGTSFYQQQSSPKTEFLINLVNRSRVLTA